MVEFLQFTLSGVVFGMIYAAVALSLVLIWRGTRLLNYGQGGMAMLALQETTYRGISALMRRTTSAEGITSSIFQPLEAPTSMYSMKRRMVGVFLK